MRIHRQLHASFEGPAAITDWAQAMGLEMTTTRGIKMSVMTRLGSHYPRYAAFT